MAPPGRSLRSGTRTQFDPSLLGRAGRISKKKKDSKNGNGVDKIPTAPPTPDRATLLLREEEQRGAGRATKGATPTCLQFGLHNDRCSQFPNHFFCEECKRWEEDYLMWEQKNRIKRSSKRYACRANHSSWIHPTTLKSSKQQHHLLNYYDEGSENDDDDDELSPGVPN
jgi:hypothetical protein